MPRPVGHELPGNWGGGPGGLQPDQVISIIEFLIFHFWFDFSFLIFHFWSSSFFIFEMLLFKYKYKRRIFQKWKNQKFKKSIFDAFKNQSLKFSKINHWRCKPFKHWILHFNHWFLNRFKDWLFDFLNFSFLKKPWGNHFIFHFSFLKMGDPIFHFSFLKYPYAWKNNKIFIFPFEAKENHKAFLLFICSSCNLV